MGAQSGLRLLAPPHEIRLLRQAAKAPILAHFIFAKAHDQFLTMLNAPPPGRGVKAERSMSLRDMSVRRFRETEYEAPDMMLRLSGNKLPKRTQLTSTEPKTQHFPRSPFIASEERVVRAIERVRATVELRKRRDARWGTAIFGEPAWEILLDLFLERAEQRKTNSMSAATASRAPVTTALRYLGILEKRGLITKRVARHDMRVHYVQLADDTFQWMVELFAD